MFYTIVCTWKVQGEIVVEASSLQEAKAKAWEFGLDEFKNVEACDEPKFAVSEDETGDGNPQY